MSGTIDYEQIKKGMLKYTIEGMNSTKDSFSSSDSLKDAGIDSFKIIELVLFLETKYNLPIPEEAFTAENLKSIDSILNCAIKHKQSVSAK
ncbi:MAG: hypothetical protein KA444_07255 [Bacteroidia bacterium]|nr:hypothetical protein [Bacteroidia bacterium]